jgi:hypothetical protein
MMRAIIDTEKVKRRAGLANLASVGGLLTLLASILLPLWRPQIASYSTILMIIGLAVSMTGIYYANRWVKRPRPEHSLNQALKGLSDRYRLYHYPRLPIDHLLLTPGGVIVIESVNLEGSFSYHDGRWREQMNIGRALRWIVEEHLGDPVKSALGAENHLKQLLDKRLPEHTIPCKSIVVFTHPRARLDVKTAQIPVCRVDKLRRQLQDKSARLPDEDYKQLQEFLDELI